MSVAPPTTPTPPPTSRDVQTLAGVVLVLAAICVASFALYVRWVVRPLLLSDDFQILIRSWTWQRTWDELWVPANEHAMPLGRLATYLLIQLAGRFSVVPYLAALQGPCAVIAGTLLLYLFVRRELLHPLYGLVAATLFGVSTVYQQSVFWFAASFSILALDTVLLALLAAQHWRRSGRLVSLVLCVFAVALAPGWFASGILAGPLCALYLLPPERISSTDGRIKALLRSARIALIPLLGTVVFLAVSLPRTAATIMHLEHYGTNRTLIESFHPLRGFQYTVWSIVENLLLGSIGIASVNVPFGLAVAVWPMVVVLGVWWGCGEPAGRRLMLLGVGLIFAGYLLVYSARAEWVYEGEMNRPGWSRYHLLPQLGLALVMVSGLPRWADRIQARRASEEQKALLALVASLFLLQLPRTIFTTPALADDRQEQELRRIDSVDDLCRRHRIAGATARAALSEFGPLEIPGCAGRENGWDFLRGSPNPDPSITIEEARRLLAPVVEKQERFYRK